MMVIVSFHKTRGNGHVCIEADIFQYFPHHSVMGHTEILNESYIQSIQRSVINQFLPNVEWPVLLYYDLDLLWSSKVYNIKQINMVL